MLHVSLLGEQVVTDPASGEVLTRSSRAIALIAFLVVHAGAPQTRQRLSLLFWPDSTDAQALTNLRRELHHLRQMLGDESGLVVTASDLCWRDTPNTRVDVRTFAMERQAALLAAERDEAEAVLVHGAAAIAEYSGEFVPGAYDDWILETRSELERQCADLCILVGRTRAEQGDLVGAIAIARRRIALQPLEEEGYRTLMELQADIGDRASAVSTYHHCASVLERELGIIPDPATRKALERLLTLDEPGDDRPAPLPPAHARFGGAAGELVGRSREIGTLHDIWRSATSGQARLAVVRGGAGVGKTRLVADIAEMARLQGAVVATAQCFGTSGRLALAPVADWLRTPAVQSVTATLDPVWRAEVERLIPPGGSRTPRDFGPNSMADAWQRHRFFEGLARALIAIGRPTVLVLDNVQWCDQETLAFITFLLGLAPDLPVLLAATRRDDSRHDDPELAEWTLRMRATGLLTELSLGPLETADTARLAEAIAGRPLPAQDLDLLQATTGGFPLYVIEAVRTTTDLRETPGPLGELTAVLRNRLGQASTTAREIAGLAAAVGRDFALDLLTEASDEPADSVVRAVDELWQLRIIHEWRDGYDFSHDLLRDTAYEQVSPPRRWLLHRRLAQSLELLHADDIDSVSAELAQQYARGGRPQRAVAYYARAAAVASSMFAYSEAIRLQEDALEIIGAQPDSRDRDRQELIVLEAMAAPLLARYGYASQELQDCLERTLGLAEKLGRKDSTTWALFGLWGSRFVQGRILECEQIALRTLEKVDADSEEGGSAHFACAGALVTIGKPAEALLHFDRAAKLTAGDVHTWTIGTRPDVHGRGWAAHAEWLVGRTADALATAQSAIQLAREIDQPYNLAVALAYAAVTHQMAGNRSALTATVAELDQLCERYRFAYYPEWALILDGWNRADDSGLIMIRRGIDNLKMQGSFARMPYWLSLLADASARCGQPARAMLDAAYTSARARDDLWWLPEVMRQRAGLESETVAVRGLVSAARLAAAQGSVALLERCQVDLAGRGVPSSEYGVPPTA